MIDGCCGRRDRHATPISREVTAAERIVGSDIRYRSAGLAPIVASRRVGTRPNTTAFLGPRHRHVGRLRTRLPFPGFPMNETVQP